MAGKACVSKGVLWGGMQACLNLPSLPRLSAAHGLPTAMPWPAQAWRKAVCVCEKGVGDTERQVVEEKGGIAQVHHAAVIFLITHAWQL